jgi:hypothetical protein
MQDTESIGAEKKDKALRKENGLAICLREQQTRKGQGPDARIELLHGKAGSLRGAMKQKSAA